MSGILKKDRKAVSEQTAVITEAEGIIQEISSAMLTKDEKDQPKISKRKMDVIGNRIINNALDAYEELRYQDKMYRTSKKSGDVRVASLYRAEKSLDFLASDIMTLEYLVPTINHHKNWYNNLQNRVIKTKTMTTHLRESTEQRYNQKTAEERIKREEKKSNNNNNKNIKIDSNNKKSEVSTVNNSNKDRLITAEEKYEELRNLSKSYKTSKKKLESIPNTLNEKCVRPVFVKYGNVDKPEIDEEFVNSHR